MRVGFPAPLYKKNFFFQMILHKTYLIIHSCWLSKLGTWAMAMGGETSLAGGVFFFYFTGRLKLKYFHSILRNTLFTTKFTLKFLAIFTKLVLWGISRPRFVGRGSFTSEIFSIEQIQNSAKLFHIWAHLKFLLYSFSKCLYQLVHRWFQNQCWEVNVQEDIGELNDL